MSGKQPGCARAPMKYYQNRMTRSRDCWTRGDRAVFFSVFVEDRLYFVESLETSALFDALRGNQPPLMLPGRKH